MPVHIENDREVRLIALVLHLALSRLLGRLFRGAVHLVEDRLLGDHIHHHEADGTLVLTDAGQTGEQIAVAVVVNDGLTLGSTVLVLIREVEDTMDIFALVVDLVDDEVLRLNTVHPVRHLIDGVVLHIAGGGIHGIDALGLRAGQSPGYSCRK